jgi:hypothetical protein
MKGFLRGTVNVSAFTGDGALKSCWSYSRLWQARQKNSSYVMIAPQYGQCRPICSLLPPI